MSKRIRCYLIVAWVLSGLIILQMAFFSYMNDYSKVSFSLNDNDVYELPLNVLQNGEEQGGYLIISSGVDLDRYTINYLRITIAEEQLKAATVTFIGADTEWNPIYTKADISLHKGINDIRIKKKDYPVAVFYFSGIRKDNIKNIQFRQRIEYKPIKGAVLVLIASAISYVGVTYIILLLRKRLWKK